MKVKIPTVLCRKCKKWTPVNIDHFENKKLKIKTAVVWCVGCELVKNVDSIPKIVYRDNEWMLKRGWKEVNHPKAR